MVEFFLNFSRKVVALAWGPPLLFLLVGGGLYLTLYSRFLPFRGFLHGIRILTGIYDRRDDPGEISHFQALSTALSSTIGMGNIGGVAIAITQGGPGTLFWMWVAAFVGMATKFFTCSLAVMYRGYDSAGKLQGGPMYYIEVGLGRSYRFLSIFFSLCGCIGCLAMFQSNQLAEILKEGYAIPRIWSALPITLCVALVILGGLQRIARVASRLVPSMCVVYFGTVLVVLLMNLNQVIPMFLWIFHEAFSFKAKTGALMGIPFMLALQTGIKRAAFSNEAGIGTAPMAHGAARTQEPIREGLVAMLGPFIDTILICSLTGFVILLAGGGKGSQIVGVSLTAQAFVQTIGPMGKHILMFVVTLFGMTTMFGYAYYGKKCFCYLFGAEKGRFYEWFYLVMLFLGALWSAELVVNILDTAFAMMAFPNMIATLCLAPRVMKATRKYLEKHASVASPAVDQAS